MAGFRMARGWVLLFAQLLFFASTTSASKVGMQPADACKDFETGSVIGSVWTLEDCMDVWEQFSSTIPDKLQNRMSVLDTWSDIASELRSVGSSCLVAADHKSDGVGSSTIRHIAAWVFSREMGCDWVTPHYGSPGTDGGNRTTMYCHRISTRDEKKLLESHGEDDKVRKMNRCSAVNWLEYFQFGVPSIGQPDEKTLNVVQLDPNPRKDLAGVQQEMEKMHSESPPWDHLLLTFSLSFASRYLVRPGGWNQNRRQIVRTVLEEARTNFHRHPRSWYDEKPDCAFDESKLNFAIHVRMGDRRTLQGFDMEYFQLLENFMATVSEVLVENALAAPLFHVFSETSMPCPSEDTGAFDEFPMWPVALDQVSACLKAESGDCDKNAVGEKCNLNRSGVFGIHEKPMLLHVGRDVQNALSCMIHADGVLMGCSTFGHVAGLLSKGISLFSTACSHGLTPYQYRLVPPMAIAEGGYLWVPITGSWRDPVLESKELFKGALDTFLATKDASS